MIDVIVRTSSEPELHAAGWAAGRRDGMVAVIIDAGLSRRRKAVAFLRALSDDEYLSLAADMPGLEGFLSGRGPLIPAQRAS